MTDTPLDRAHAAMEADETRRPRFFERLAEAELFLLVTEEPKGQEISPEIFETDGARIVLAFDREDRLSDFTGRVTPYAALSGRALAAMLAGRGIGLGLNLDVAPSSTLLPPEALDWLHETLGDGPARVDARPQSVAPPSGLPEALLTALDAKLAAAEGLARHAYLVSVTYAPNRPGHLLAFVGARPGAEPALARAVSEALTFSGLEAGELDVGFFAAADPFAATLARHGLRFDLPQPGPARAVRAAPGTDPDRPPRLR